MEHDDGAQVTRFLRAWSDGDKQALDDLMPLVQRKLRQIARGHLRRESPGHTLQPTALVNEAYLRIVDQDRVRWQDRAHFFGIAAQMMRRILVDHARKKQAEKRGGDMARLTFDEEVDAPDEKTFEMIALDDALTELAKLDSRQARVVVLRFFGGLSVEETAAVLEISKATVKREWSTAKAWLYRELKRRR